MSSQVREMEKGDEIPYEEGRLVRNWARSFEARTERFYTPQTEEEVVQVYLLFSVYLGSVILW